MKFLHTKAGHVVAFLIADVISVICAALIAWFSTPTQEFNAVVLCWILANIAVVVLALLMVLR